MNSYRDTLSLITKAENADGFAIEVNDKRMESIDAKTKIFTATLDGMWQSLINDGAIKGTVEVGTNILSFVTNINKGLGTIPTLAGAAVAALSLLGKNAGRNMPSYVKLVA